MPDLKRLPLATLLSCFLALERLDVYSFSREVMSKNHLQCRWALRGAQCELLYYDQLIFGRLAWGYRFCMVGTLGGLFICCITVFEQPVQFIGFKIAFLNFL